MSALTQHPDFARGRAEARDEIERTTEPISDVMRRWDAERALDRVDPLLARLLRAEALADQRADNHVCVASKMPMIRDLLREAVEAHTGKPFENPIYP